MYYKGTLSFKDEVSPTQRPVIITNIINAGGKLTLADCNYFDITIETQDPTHNGVGVSTGVSDIRHQIIEERKERKQNMRDPNIHHD